MAGSRELSVKSSARMLPASSSPLIEGSAGTRRRSKNFLKNDCARFWSLVTRAFLALWDCSACFRSNSLSMSSLRTALHSSEVISPVFSLCCKRRTNFGGKKDLKSFGTGNLLNVLRWLNHTPIDAEGINNLHSNPRANRKSPDLRNLFE